MANQTKKENLMSISTNITAIFKCSSTCVHSVVNLKTVVNNWSGSSITVSPENINEWFNTKNSCLILPGGRCSGWDNELPQDFQHRLREWWLKGNKIFATCAGAYYCSTVSSYKDANETLLKYRAVKLFPGICQGPLYKDLKIVKIRWHTGEEGH